MSRNLWTAESAKLRTQFSLKSINEEICGCRFSIFETSLVWEVLRLPIPSDIGSALKYPCNIPRIFFQTQCLFYLHSKLSKSLQVSGHGSNEFWMNFIDFFYAASERRRPHRHNRHNQVIKWNMDEACLTLGTSRVLMVTVHMMAPVWKADAILSSIFTPTAVDSEWHRSPVSSPSSQSFWV